MPPFLAVLSSSVSVGFFLRAITVLLDCMLSGGHYIVSTSVSKYDGQTKNSVCYIAVSVT